MTKRYEVFFAAAARKELRKLGPSVAAEIIAQIDKKLTTNPAGYGEALHAELAGYYKLRVSGFRVVYRTIEERVWVLVLAAGKRNEGNVDNIYDQLSADILETREEDLVREIESKHERADER